MHATGHLHRPQLCRVILIGLSMQDQEYYDRIPEAGDDENDLLDLAFGLTDT